MIKHNRLVYHLCETCDEYFECESEPSTRCPDACIECEEQLEEEAEEKRQAKEDEENETEN